MISRALLLIGGGAALLAAAAANNLLSFQDLQQAVQEKSDGGSLFDAATGKEWSELKARNREALRQANRQIPVGRCTPNIVLIVVDDLGYGDLGCYGQEKIKTPRIDEMAAEGIRFTQYYSGAAVGTPSRCSLMTGLHTGHCRLRGNTPARPLQPADVTTAEVLWKAGYETYFVGTWALGEENTGVPHRQGFEKAFGYLNRQRAQNYFPPFLWRNGKKVLINANQENRKGKFSHDLLTQEALSVVSSRRKRRPFFLQLSFTAPHANLADLTDVEPYAAEKWPMAQKRYAAMITRIDTSVGKILDRLKEHRLDHNTIVILTADNGPHSDGVDPQFFNSAGTFRGSKGSLYEGGIRVPMIMYRQGWFPKGKGRVSDHVWAAWDLLPTLADLSGAWRRPKGIDGVSLAPTLRGGVQFDHKYLYWESHETGFVQAIRRGQWKGLRRGLDGPLELYDLAEDPGEKNNIAARNPKIVKELTELLKQARTESAQWPARKPAGKK